MTASIPASASPRLGLGSRLVRFGLVGGVGFLVDVGIFNLLRGTVWAPAHLAEGPLLAKVVSTLCAIAVNWMGNRYWAFRDHRRSDVAREGFAFLAVSLLGLVVSVACLWISHDLLGLHTALDDNIATNFVGLGLGTAVRFALYRSWVYRAR